MNTDLLDKSLINARFAEEKKYWQEQLSCHTEISTFNHDRLVCRDKDLQRIPLVCAVPYQVTERLRQVSNNSDQRLYIILNTALTVLLYKHTARRDIVIGCPLYRQANTHAHVNKYLVMRNQVQPDMTFLTLLKQVEHHFTKANENANYPLEFIREEWQRETGNTGTTFFDVLLALRSIHDTPDLDIGLTCTFREEAAGMEAELLYDPQKYQTATIRMIFSHFINILQRALSSPQQQMSALDILAADEKKRILYDFNDTRTPYAEHKTMTMLFEEQVARTPGNPALLFKNQQISYGELNKQANQVACFLHKQGVGPGTAVAILLERSPAMICGVMGVLKAGGFYVPLEPFFPDERIKGILKDLQVSHLLTQYSQRNRIYRFKWDVPSLEHIYYLDLQQPDFPGEEPNSREVESLWNYIIENSTDEISAGGFFSSYTGAAFTEQEVNQYVSHVSHLAEPYLGRDKAVMEIGCGSGLILTALSPRVKHYIGLDPAEKALAFNRSRLAEQAACHVTLLKGYAHEIDTLADIQPGSLDMVILASTIQFFPGAVYLEQVIEKILKLLKMGGVLLLADIPDWRQKEFYARSLEKFKHQQGPSAMGRPRGDLEDVFYIAADFFRELPGRLPSLGEVKILNRPEGLFTNELRFRYDVILKKQAAAGRQTANPGGLKHWTNHHWQHCSTGNPQPVARADDLAYVIFTSGTTGQPKGVAVRHKPVINLIEWVHKTFDVSPADRLLFVTSLCFDLSVFDIFGMLASGGSIRIAAREDLQAPDRLADMLAGEFITFWDSAPAALQQLVPFLASSQAGRTVDNLRLVFLSGDWIPLALPGQIRRFFPAARVISLGGATEATVWSNYYPIGKLDPAWVSIPYGKPIQNACYYILDGDMNVCPTGVPGDLYIGGDCLASGYINDQALTAAKFLPNPFLPAAGAIMYKTGDTARWYPDGNMEFLGRKDHQLKIRGYRIEAGEIECRLTECPAVNDALVLARDDNTGNKYLCAFYTGEREIPVEDLRAFLGKQLPGYMIPSYFVHLDKLPVTGSGKVDRKALPEVGRENAVSSQYREPVTETEKQLAEIWIKVLGVSRVGLDDNFFELGGHSLKAINMLSGIHKKFNVELPLQQIFREGTLQAIAGRIDRAEQHNYAAIEPAVAADFYPVSPSQYRMFYMRELEGSSTSYNIPVATEIRGKLDRDHLQQVLKQLTRRHEAFRTGFLLVDNQPVQVIHPQAELELELADSTEQEIDQRITAFIRPFDLDTPPLARALLLRLSDTRHILVFDMHHIIADGTSMGVLTREFAQLYNGEQLSPLRIQYRDYAVWQQTRIRAGLLEKQAEFWKQELKERIDPLRMPVDKKRSRVMTYLGKTVKVTVTSGQTRGLKQLADRNNCSLNFIFIGIYAILLSCYSLQKKICLGSLVAGRNHPDLENQIGMFLNFLPLRLSIDPELTVEAFFKALPDQLIPSYSHQDYPFEQMLDVANYTNDPSRNPLFDTMLIYHNEATVKKIETGELSFQAYDYTGATSKLDFKLDIIPDDFFSGHLCCFEFNTSLFSGQTMKRVTEDFCKIIEFVLSGVDRRLADIRLFEKTELKAWEQKRNLNIPRQFPVVICASFTAEPVRDYLLWWSREFKQDLAIKFAPYNQPFQQLLDPGSLFASNTGLNVLLVRPEDWIRETGSNAEEQCRILQENFKRWQNLFTRLEIHIPVIAAVFPVSGQYSGSPSVMAALKNCTEEYRQLIRCKPNVHELDLHDVAEDFAVSQVYNAINDREGHIPFSNDYIAALGTSIARKICACLQPPFKVIALDCDNTLWSGICGEDGLAGIKVDAPCRELQMCLLAKYNQGFLLTLCSKNNEENVWEVFEHKEGMLLEKKHFVNWRINWQPKSANLRAMARELNLGIDSFIFIDDNPQECHEVMLNCPEVLTLCLPEDRTSISGFLKHIWALDILQVTETDRLRSQMYQDEQKRKSLQSHSRSVQDYIRELEVLVSFDAVKTEQLNRVSQLTYRTNQFNLSTRRRSVADIELLLQDPSNACWAVTVRDKFGSYGLTGVIITRQQDDAVLYLDTFLLSCRVLGRNVEQTLLVCLKRLAEETGCRTIVAPYRATEKNQPVKNFLTGGRWQDPEPGMTESGRDTGQVTSIYSIPTAQITEELPVAHIFYKEELPSPITDDDHELILQLDHIAVATRNIRQARDLYNLLGYRTGKVIFDPEQNVHLVMCTHPDYDAVELVSPADGSSPVNNLLEGKNNVPYHLCYRVNTISAFLEHIKAAGIAYRMVSDEKPAILFENKMICFVNITGAGLIELLADRNIPTSHNIKQSTIQYLIPEHKKAMAFFSALGYSQSAAHENGQENVFSILLIREGCGQIELQLPLDRPLPGETGIHSVLKQRGPHPARLILNMENPYEFLNHNQNLNQNQEPGSGYQAVMSDFYPDSRAVHFTDYEYQLMVAARKTNTQTRKSWKVEIHNPEQLLHKAYLEAVNLCTAARLRQLPLYTLWEENLPTAIYEEPGTDMEKILHKIWLNTLGIPRLGINDNFFSIGGDSIKAIQVVSLLRQKGYELEREVLLQYPTIKELAPFIIDYQADQTAARQVRAVEDKFPLLAVQRWFFRTFKTLNHWNSSQLFYSPAGFADELIGVLLKEIIMRHEALRVVFVKEGVEHFHLVKDSYTECCHFVTCDLRGVEDYRTRILQEMHKAQHSLDVYNGPLLAVALYKTDEGDHLYVVVHHILVDAISFGILTEDMFIGYSQLVRGQQLALPPRTASFSAAARQVYAYANSREIQEEYHYWKKVVKTPLKSLPRDYTACEEDKIEKYIYTLDAVILEGEEVTRLKKVREKMNIPLYDIMLAAWGYTVQQWTGADKAYVNVSNNGRNWSIGNLDITRTIGPFWSSYPVMLDMSCSGKILDQVLDTHAMLKAVPNDGRGYNVLREIVLGERRAELDPYLNFTDVFFNFLGEQVVTREADGSSALSLSPLMQDLNRNENARWTQTFNLKIAVQQETIFLSFLYNTREYKQTTIEAIIEHYRAGLRELLS